jgi:hypothetical protein
MLGKTCTYYVRKEDELHLLVNSPDYVTVYISTVFLQCKNITSMLGTMLVYRE